MSNSNEHLNTENTNVELQESYYSIKSHEPITELNEEVLYKALQTIQPINLLNSAEIIPEETLIPVTPGVCRICLQTDLDDSNKCITPCFCRGSISKVHRLCLETWLAQADITDCEICKFKYKTKRITKYSLLGSLKAWILNNDRQEEVHELMHDGTILFLTVPLMLLLSYSGFSITNHVFNGEISWPLPTCLITFLLQSLIDAEFATIYRIISFGACSTIMCADFFFAFWTSCRIQQHISNWFDFYKRNQLIVIIDPKFPEDNT